MTRVLLSGRVYDHQVGGNTRYVRSVYDRIAEHGVEFHVGRLPQGVNRGKVRSAAFALAEGLVWPRFTPSDVDVVHFPADTGSVVKSSKPVVGTIHGLATLHMPGVRSTGADALWRGRVRRLARTSDRIVTVSQTSADDIAFFEPSVAERIEVIHHGIDHQTFNTRPLSGAEATLRNLGVPEHYFFYAGNLDPRKNVVALTQAASLTFRATGVPLVISGAPAWDSEEILRSVRETEGVIYLGRVPDDALITLMQNAVAFCFPSHYEGFGFPVLEAMACGSPVICSDKGSLAEVAGDAALVIDKRDPDTIAQAMQHLLGSSSEQERLRAAGLANAARFDWDASSARHAEIFHSLAR